MTYSLLPRMLAPLLRPHAARARRVGSHGSQTHDIGFELAFPCRHDKNSLRNSMLHVSRLSDLPDAVVERVRDKERVRVLPGYALDAVELGIRTRPVQESLPAAAALA